MGECVCVPVMRVRGAWHRRAVAPLLPMPYLRPSCARGSHPSRPFTFTAPSHPSSQLGLFSGPCTCTCTCTCTCNMRMTGGSLLWPLSRRQRRRDRQRLRQPRAVRALVRAAVQVGLPPCALCGRDRLPHTRAPRAHTPTPQAPHFTPDSHPIHSSTTGVLIGWGGSPHSHRTASSVTALSHTSCTRFTPSARPIHTPRMALIHTPRMALVHTSCAQVRRQVARRVVAP